MTSEERRNGRYLRRQRSRNSKRKAMNHDETFSYENLYAAYQKCRKGVGWKASVQKYVANAPLKIWDTYMKLQRSSFRSDGFCEFDIYERGKIRHIQSVNIEERVVQKCLCDHALVPALERTFVYDNGASMKNKGYTFAVKRLCTHLEKHYRKFGAEGYILLFDFSKFFDRVSHEVVNQIVMKEITDERIQKITSEFVDAFGDVGLGLGSQISQVLALASANKLDHYIKEVLRIRGYGRSMDDGYLIHPSKTYLKHCLQEMKKVCEELGIVLNEKKTRIVELAHGFTFLKIRFFLLQSGKIVRKIYKRSVTKMRQKLKKFRKLLDEGRIDAEDVYMSWNSWKAYAESFDAYHTIQNMKRLYNDLFIRDWRRENVL